MPRLANVHVETQPVMSSFCAETDGAAHRDQLLSDGSQGGHRQQCGDLAAIGCGLVPSVIRLIVGKHRVSVRGAAPCFRPARCECAGQVRGVAAVRPNGVVQEALQMQE
jgi:hypothetical protein